MSIYDLMTAVREGKFENEFKKCNSTEDKINLFKKYGVLISVEQYEKIENKVAAIKKGEDSAYDMFEEPNNSKSKIENIGDFRLSKVSAGTDKSSVNIHNEIAVFNSLKVVMPGPNEEQGQKADDSDVKH